jgi:hypothetical protein
MSNTINQISKVKRNFLNNLQTLNDEKIKKLILEFNECKDIIKDLRKEDTSSMSKSEFYHHQKKLDLQVKKRVILLGKLSSLGHHADKRGRPKKNESEKYKFKHTRISCYFTKNNIQALKTLKEEGSIENISAFLNELLDTYFSLVTKDGGYNEKEN